MLKCIPGKGNNIFAKIRFNSRFQITTTRYVSTGMMFVSISPKWDVIFAMHTYLKYVSTVLDIQTKMLTTANGQALSFHLCLMCVFLNNSNYNCMSVLFRHERVC